MQKRRTRGKFPTVREKDILHLIAEYHSYEDICRELGMTLRTLQNQVYRLMVKIGIHRKEQLMKYAIEHGYGKREEAV